MSLILKYTSTMKWVTGIVFFTFSMGVNAQVSFIVYQVKGEAYFQSGSKKEPLKMGQKIIDNDYVVTGKNSTVTLISGNYCNVNLKAAGNYSFSQINKLCKLPVGEGANSYFKFIWDQVNQDNNAPENDRKTKMNNKGAVVRGCPGIQFPNWVDTIRYFTGDLSFKWKTGGGKIISNFLLFKTEDAASTLLSITCSGDSVQLAELARKYKQPGNYFWTVGVNNKMDCPKHYIEFWSKNNFVKFCNDYLNNFKTMEVSANEKNYILGYYLEQHRFYADAMRYYKTALLADPKNELYQRTVDDYKKNY